MKLLVFEYATALGIEDPSITVEGRNILEGLLNDLKSTGADYISPESAGIGYKPRDGEEKCNPVAVDGDLTGWLGENLSKYDACLAVAPEENLILYEITKILEKNDVLTIGSSSGAVFACSDKVETHRLLKDDHPVVNGGKVSFNELKEHKNIFTGDRKMLVKPADGVSCTGVQVVRSYADFIKATAHLKRNTSLPYFLLQDYVEGVSTSVSILSTGKESVALSLNRQKININQGKLEYNGGEVPYEHPLAVDAKEIASKAVKSIGGLKGYVGVDLLLGEEQVHILEINPRLTTSYVALRQLLNFNLGKAIIGAVKGELPEDIEINGSLSFHKGEEITFK